MKRLAIASSLIAFAALAAAPALAQNAAQIEAVKRGASCAGCNLFQADFDYENIGGRNLSGARLRQSDMSLATADRTNFARADLSIANLYGIRATGANFSRANLNRTVLVGGSFDGANFAGANLAEANISGAEMSRARGLTQAQLSRACGDATTLLPRGLTVPTCR
jgi:uncharacterized protein YjbI with pentapeptide repeats